jgi:hypothetical protein
MRRRLPRPCRSPVWDFLTEQVWLMITRADRRAEVYQLALLPSCGPNSATPLRAHRAACHHQAWRRHGQESGEQLPARPPAPLARAGADPVAELLTAAACRPSSMNRCGDRGTCELA